MPTIPAILSTLAMASLLACNRPFSLETPPPTVEDTTVHTAQGGRTAITAIEAAATIAQPALAIPVAIVWTIRQAAAAGIFGTPAAALANNAAYHSITAPPPKQPTAPADKD